MHVSALIGALALAQGTTALFGSGDSPYVPVNTSCPQGNDVLVRKATDISQQEKQWVQGRDAVTKENLANWLAGSNLTDFDAHNFLSNSSVRVGLAFSGGGFRAMLAGAGQLAALDNRTTGANDKGGLGGLLQASTYLAGLSGGNWLVGSVVVNNWTSVQELQNDKNAWDLSHSLFSPGGWNVLKNFDYWKTIIQDINHKEDAGFNASLTDLWGRGLGYRLFANFENGGQGLQYSDVRQYDAFKNHEMPFPIHVADGRAPGEVIISANSSVYEINPFEMGSWDPNTYNFVDLQYVGTELNNGKPVNQGQCVTGFDNACFVVGTSATLFNQFILQLNTTGVGGAVKDLAEKLLTKIGKDGDDIAVWVPNPFKGIPDYPHPELEYLSLVDGGEDGQNVPLHPLIQPQRKVDAILAFDNSADTYDDNPLGANLPDGASLIKTYQRQFSTEANKTIFPHVPDNHTFIYGGYTLRPTFFGCDNKNFTDLFQAQNVSQELQYDPPVIIYVANAIHSYHSNVSTFDLNYDTVEVAGMIQNGYETVTQNNGTTDPEWRTCLSCALILREQQRRGEQPTAQCQSCLSKYCWDGKLVEEASSDGIKRPDGQSNTPANTTPGSGKTAASGEHGSGKKSAAATYVPSSFLTLSIGLVAVFATLF